MSPVRGNRAWLTVCMVLLVAVAALDTTSIRAQPAPASGDVEERARRLDRAARELYAEGHYASACRAWEDLLALLPDLTTLATLGHCREKAGDLTGAMRAFEDAVARAQTGASDAHRQGLEKRLGEVRALIPTVRVHATPLTWRIVGKIEWDGTALDPSTWQQPASLNPGRRTLIVTSLANVKFHEKTIDLAARTKIEIPVPVMDVIAGAPLKKRVAVLQKIEQTTTLVYAGNEKRGCKLAAEAQAEHRLLHKILLDPAVAQRIEGLISICHTPAALKLYREAKRAMASQHLSQVPWNTSPETAAAYRSACAKLEAAVGMYADAVWLVDLAGCHFELGEGLRAHNEARRARLVAEERGTAAVAQWAGDLIKSIESTLAKLEVRIPDRFRLAAIELRGGATGRIVVDTLPPDHIIVVEPGEYQVLIIDDAGGMRVSRVTVKSAEVKVVDFPREIEPVPWWSRLPLGVPPASAAPRGCRCAIPPSTSRDEEFGVCASVFRSRVWPWLLALMVAICRRRARRRQE